MDNSWKMRKGILTLPRLSSPEELSRHSFSAYSNAVDPDDFSDVFGGPPRRLLCRKFSCESKLYYEEVFRFPEFVSAPKKSARNLPVFRIPARDDAFYSDIFGSDTELRSREQSGSSFKTKSKSNSSSVLSSEELSSLRAVIGKDPACSYCSANVRPIHVPHKWNSFKLTTEINQNNQGMPIFPCNCSVAGQYVQDESMENFRGSYGGFGPRLSSPETMTLDPNSFRSIKVSIDDLELNPPSSSASSMCRELGGKSPIQGDGIIYPEQEEEEDVGMNSYVIEIASYNREGTSEAVDIDEVIAWAKEKGQRQPSESDLSLMQNKNEHVLEPEERPSSFKCLNQTFKFYGAMQPAEKEEQRSLFAEKEISETEKDMQMGIERLDEEVKQWSEGKENNIWLLLSTLHHILWPNSGWDAVPLASIIESSQVRMAYQKATFCLHPDKLHQRGATVSQKYVAEKALSILQAAFVSQDIYFN